jgi:hypothetical protein
MGSLRNSVTFLGWAIKVGNVRLGQVRPLIQGTIGGPHTMHTSYLDICIDFGGKGVILLTSEATVLDSRPCLVHSKM